MLHRLRLRAVLALAALAVAFAAPGLALAAPAHAAAAPTAIGGAQLAGHGVIVNYGSSRVARLPKVQASAFVIADASTGQVLAARAPHGEYRPASTLKVLTAIALIPLLNPDGTVVATKQAAVVTPDVVGIIPGHAYKISDLFTAMLTISANDAAVALTQATGSFSEGMAAINAEARHLQADDTVAIQPNGLDAPGQHTSAYDLALIARQALRLPAFLKYDETITAKFPVSAHKSVTLYNQNSLLTSYPGAVGGKIGWTSAAGATYIGIARRNGVTLIVTLMHCPARTEIDSAMSLLNWGFAADGKVTPVGTLVSARPPAASASASATASGASGASGASRSGRPAAGRAASLARSHRAAAGPSVLVAAGFSGVTLVAVGFGFAYNRRQRPAARYRVDARR
ncbi:MAG TPA: serine hydrolase [Streptosporangiaceae bacterium]|jgi:D-alanyl-D-alanine carboxypeptidase (penicillin-binding protein 5/6)|nr:serine hydrolase [Streptosporangiaceae bacterium]